MQQSWTYLTATLQRNHFYLRTYMAAHNDVCRR